MSVIILLALVLISGVAATVTIRHDGYGSRPGPRSHHDPFPTYPGPNRLA